MSNPSKQRGTAAEVAVIRYLNNNGYPDAERRTLSGSKDRGDIQGIPGVVVEVKACRATDLAGWLREAKVEATNAGVPIGVVWAKRRGTTNPGDWYVHMDGATFLYLLDDGAL